MMNKPTFLGTVQDAQGATISIALNKDTVSGLVFINGHGYRIGQIGSFVRIPIGYIDLFGIVSQVGVGAVPDAILKEEPHGYRWLKVQLIGEGKHSGEFKRGITQYPTIGDEVHLITEKDLVSIYGRSGSNKYVRIGSLASAESIPALVDIDKLITRHSAVVGATGAGKSTTVANLLSSLSDPQKYPSSRIIVLDIHGEYHSALADRATIFKINAIEEQSEKTLFIPYWALSFDELIQVTPFQNINDVEQTGLIEKIKKLKYESIQTTSRNGVTLDTLTVDSPVPFSIHRLWYELYRLVCSTHTTQGVNQNTSTEAIARDKKGNAIIGNIMNVQPPQYLPITSGGDNRIYLSGSQLNIRRPLLALETLLRDTRYDFLFRPGPWCPHPTHENPNAQPEKDIDELLKLWLGGDKPITILDLSGIPVSILTDLIGVLLRLLFDALFWARNIPEGGRKRPLLIVLEEAHAYLNSGNNSLGANAARRIVKEGRKYGLGVMVVSQRPAEIDTTILSQCGTIIAMRLANPTDRSHVISTVSDNLEGLFNMLPSLRTGEAIVVGEAVHLPLNVCVDTPDINRRPDSNDPKIYDPENIEGWNRNKQEENYLNVVEKWRNEKP